MSETTGVRYPQPKCEQWVSPVDDPIMPKSHSPIPRLVLARRRPSSSPMPKCSDDRPSTVQRELHAQMRSRASVNDLN